MNYRRRSSSSNIEETGNSHFLLLHLVRTVVEKHGGNMEIDEKINTFTVNVPENRKAACYQELEEIIGPVKPLSESYFSLH